MSPITKVTLAAAREIVAAAREAGREGGFNPMSFVVLDAGGHVIAFEREDGSSNARFQIAYSKAYGAVSLGLGSRALMNRAETQPYFINGATAAIGGFLVPVPGGVLIKNADGDTIGAVGATGDTPDNDEVAAVAGITAAGFVAVTG
jgi:uncharacterized protein GlcG (DUF336 family)